jgi:polygalacturonase
MPDRRTLLAGGLGAAACAPLPRVAPGPAPSPWARADAIARDIRLPRIAARDETITAHGARSGFGHDARPAILAAMAALGPGGGRVVLPPGEWRSDGPITLRSGVALHLAEGATLRFSREPRHYLPLVLTRWEGTECWNYSPLIYARGAQDIAITGRGVIDGQGYEGFFQWRGRQRADQMALRRMGAEGVPVDRRVFGEGHYLRPGFVQFLSCRRVLVEGVRLIDSTFWMIHPVYCDHVTVRGISLKSDHLNSDGVDPDSSTNVLIEGCLFDVGDDGVAIKAGRDQDGWRVARPSRRIVVRDCVYSGTAGGGMAIGSEMSGGVEEVFCERYRMNEVAHGLYLKSNNDRGGHIRDVHFRDVEIGRAQCPLIVTTDYHGYRGGAFPTRMTDLSVTDVRCADAIVGLSLVGAQGAPLRSLRLRNIEIGQAKTPMRIRNVEGLAFDTVRINGTAMQPVSETGPDTFLDKLKS